MPRIPLIMSAVLMVAYKRFRRFQFSPKCYGLGFELPGSATKADHPSVRKISH